MKIKPKGKEANPTKDLVEAGEKQLATSFFNSISHPRKRRWLSVLSKTGRIRETSRLTKIHAENHYNWLEHDADYALAVEKAMQIAADYAEDEVFRRGFEGFSKPVIYKGRITDWYKDYSDTLAIFWLKGAKPEKYRDNLVGLTSNAPIAIQINFSPEAKPEEEPRPQDIVIEDAENK